MWFLHRKTVEFIEKMRNAQGTGKKGVVFLGERSGFLSLEAK